MNSLALRPHALSWLWSGFNNFLVTRSDTFHFARVFQKSHSASTCFSLPALAETCPRVRNPTPLRVTCCHSSPLHLHPSPQPASAASHDWEPFWKCVQSEHQRLQACLLADWLRASPQARAARPAFPKLLTDKGVTKLKEVLSNNVLLNNVYLWGNVLCSRSSQKRYNEMRPSSYACKRIK